MNSTAPSLNRFLAVAVLGVAMAVCYSSRAAAPDQEAVSEAKPRLDLHPLYPYELVVQGKAGWAEARFTVDYVGRPLFTVFTGASDRSFAKAAVAMTEANQYVATKKNNHPVLTPSSIRYEFGGDKSLDEGERRVLAELRKAKPALCEVSQLDERPKAIMQQSAVYPRAMKDDGVTGQAEIEFVIDREGRALFPKIVSASVEDFGWAAAAAVAQWRFQPPTRKGQPVDAVMRVPVLFDARQLASAD